MPSRAQTDAFARGFVLGAAFMASPALGFALGAAALGWLALSRIHHSKED